eukprot:1159433-Pelagomonas_calceolata.AAC.6
MIHPQPCERLKVHMPGGDMEAPKETACIPSNDAGDACCLQQPEAGPAGRHGRTYDRAGKLSAQSSSQAQATSYKDRHTNAIIGQGAHAYHRTRQAGVAVYR